MIIRFTRESTIRYTQARTFTYESFVLALNDDKKMEIRGIKEAVKNGVTFLKSVYEDANAIRVEEVEMDD